MPVLRQSSIFNNLNLILSFSASNYIRPSLGTTGVFDSWSQVYFWEVGCKNSLY